MYNPYATAIVNNIKASIKPKTNEKTPINTQANPTETIGRPAESVGRPADIVVPPQPQSMNEPAKHWNVTNWYFCIPLACEKENDCAISLCHCFCAQFWLCNKLFKCDNKDHHCRGCLHYSNNLGWLFGGCLGVFSGINYTPLGFYKNDNNCCALLGLCCHKEVSRKGNDYQLRECLGCWCIQKYKKERSDIMFADCDCCDCFTCCNYGIGCGPFGITKENCYPFWCDLSDGAWIIKNRLINCQIMKEKKNCVKGCAMGCLVCHTKGEIEQGGKKYKVEKGIKYCLPWNRYEMV
jgi:hypothetical protein